MVKSPLYVSVRVIFKFIQVLFVYADKTPDLCKCKLIKYNKLLYM